LLWAGWLGDSSNAYAFGMFNSLLGRRGIILIVIDLVTLDDFERFAMILEVNDSDVQKRQ
jgi:hypothetical protein